LIFAQDPWACQVNWIELKKAAPSIILIVSTANREEPFLGPSHYLLVEPDNGKPRYLATSVLPLAPESRPASGIRHRSTPDDNV